MVFYEYSKKDERDGWTPAKATETTEHTVICRRPEKGIPMNVDIGDVRLLQNNELSRRLTTVDTEEDTPDSIEDEDEVLVVTMMDTEAV